VRKRFQVSGSRFQKSGTAMYEGCFDVDKLIADNRSLTPET